VDDATCEAVSTTHVAHGIVSVSSKTTLEPYVDCHDVIEHGTLSKSLLHSNGLKNPSGRLLRMMGVMSPSSSEADDVNVFLNDLVLLVCVGCPPDDVSDGDVSLDDE